MWWENSGQELERQFNTLVYRGYNAKILNTNEIKYLEPNLQDIPKEAIFTSHEGAAEEGYNGFDLKPEKVPDTSKPLDFNSSVGYWLGV